MNEIVRPLLRPVGELLVEDSIEALNAVLERAQIRAEDIITVLPVPRITPAIGDHKPKLRVLYRLRAQV